MAGYLVLTGIIAVNIQAWVIARHYGWRYDWHYQVVGIPLMIALGYATKLLVGLGWELEGVAWFELLVPALITCSLYTGFVILAIWVFPWLIGMNKDDLSRMLLQLRKGFGYVGV
jgi:hypothetical protein